MDFLAGNDIAIVVSFAANGQPKVPDSGTAKYTLRSDSGSVLLSNQDITVSPGANTAVVSILAANNAITARYEHRSLQINFKVGGAQFTTMLRYRLLPFLNLEISEHDVRSFLGLDVDELDDAEIDLPTSYFGVETTLTQAVLDAALYNTPAVRKAGNDAVLFSAILAVIPSIKLRTAQQRIDGPLTFSRFSSPPNWDDIQEDAQDRLSAALDLVSGRAISSYPLITVALPVDVITGV